MFLVPRVLYKVSPILQTFNHLNADLNSISHLLALLGAHHISHISRIRVKLYLAVTCTVEILTKKEIIQIKKYCNKT